MQSEITSTLYNFASELLKSGSKLLFLLRNFYSNSNHYPREFWFIFESFFERIRICTRIIFSGFYLSQNLLLREVLFLPLHNSGEGSMDTFRVTLNFIFSHTTIYWGFLQFFFFYYSSLREPSHIVSRFSLATWKTSKMQQEM